MIICVCVCVCVPAIVQTNPDIFFAIAHAIAHVSSVRVTDAEADAQMAEKQSESFYILISNWFVSSVKRCRLLPRLVVLPSKQTLHLTALLLSYFASQIFFQDYGEAWERIEASETEAKPTIYISNDAAFFNKRVSKVFASQGCPCTGSFRRSMFYSGVDGQ